MDWFDEHIQFTTVEPDVFVRVGEFAFDNSCSYTAISKCCQKCSLPNLYNKICKAHISKITEVMYVIATLSVYIHSE